MDVRDHHDAATPAPEPTAVTTAAEGSGPVVETFARRPPGAASDDGPSLRPGEDVGPYRLEAPIGQGGMGVVWRARRRSGGLVAIKFLRRAGRIDADDMADEFRVQASLHHPHVMAAFDHGTHRTPEGTSHHYLVMPWIEDARTLDAFVAEQQVDAIGRIRLFLAVAAGLAHAHAKGVVHRDLKPANILVDRYGHLRLCDFGLAGLTFDGVAAESAGTPGYRAPEQCRGRGPDLLDQRTDVWALGLILHELLTGRRPTDVAASGTVQSPPAIRDLDVACREEIPDLLPAIDHLIGRCLQERRDDRPADAAEVLAEARAIIEATGLVTFLGRLAGGRPRLRAAAAGAVTLLAAFVLSVAFAGPLLAVLPVPVDTLRAALPAPAALDRAAGWPDVVLVPFEDGSLERLRAGDAGIAPRAETPGLAAARPGPLARRSWRPLHAEAIRRAVAAGASVVWLDIFFEEPDPAGDAALAGAITAARAAGVPVIVGARRLPAQAGGPPPIAPALLDAGVLWGGASAEQGGASGDDRLIQHDLLTVRGGDLLAPSMAVLAAAHHVANGRTPVLDGSDHRILVRDGDAAWRRGSATMLVLPVTRAVDAPERPDLRALGIRPGDRLLVQELRVPDEASFDAATLPYERLWTPPPPGDPRSLEGRIVLIYDQDHDAPTAPPVRRTARGHGWSAQAMLAGGGIRVARWWNVPLVLAGGGVGLLVGRLASRRHERRTARVGAGGGQRVGVKPAFSLLVLGLALVLAAVPLLATTAIVHASHALLLHPLPGILAAGAAALLILHGPRATDLVGRLGPRPRSTPRRATAGVPT